MKMIYHSQNCDAVSCRHTNRRHNRSDWLQSVQNGALSVGTGEFVEQPPGSEDDKEGVEDNNDAHRTNENPKKVTFQRQPAAS